MAFTRKTDHLAMQKVERKQDGFALIAVLLFLMITSAIITPMVLAARTDFQLASRKYLNTRLAVLAEGILNVVIWQLATFTESKNDNLLLNSAPMQAVCGNHAITIVIQDQASLIDINVAPLALLEAGFNALDFSRGDASELGKTVIAYRLPEDAGANIPNMADELSVGLKHFAFEAIEELYEFPGFAKMSPDDISKVFTIYGRRESVNSQNMSDILSKILPDQATGQFPFIVEGEFPLLYGEIRVKVESLDFNASGFSGAMIEIPEGQPGIYNILERVVDPGILGSKKRFNANARCEDLFGGQIAALVANS